MGEVIRNACSCWACPRGACGSGEAYYREEMEPRRACSLPGSHVAKRQSRKESPGLPGSLFGVFLLYCNYLLSQGGLSEGLRSSIFARAGVALAVEEVVGKETGPWVNTGGSQRPPPPPWGLLPWPRPRRKEPEPGGKQPGTSGPHSSGCRTQEGPAAWKRPQAAVLMLLGEGS